MGKTYQITRSAHGLDTSFMEDALCHAEGHRGDLFYAELGRSAGERATTMEARSVCMRCPVQVDCFQYAVEADEHGVWGGTTRDERLHYRLHGSLPLPKPLRRRR